jgi:hypothetical protein
MTASVILRRNRIVEHERLWAVGLDLGTGGVRALALDLSGRVVVAGRHSVGHLSRRCTRMFSGHAYFFDILNRRKRFQITSEEVLPFIDDVPGERLP